MATIAKWNGHKFEVSARRITGFTDLSIKGSCDTEAKIADNQAHVERKNGAAPEISMTVTLNALTGVKNVYKEAMGFVKDAINGETGYFYLGSGKLFSEKLMLTSAQVTEIDLAPGRGDQWISCKVQLTMKQGTGQASSSSGGGGGGRKGGGKPVDKKAQKIPTRQQFTAVGDPKKPQSKLITGTPMQFGYHPPRPSLK